MRCDSLKDYVPSFTARRDACHRIRSRQNTMATHLRHLSLEQKLPLCHFGLKAVIWIISSRLDFERFNGLPSVHQASKLKLSISTKDHCYSGLKQKKTENPWRTTGHTDRKDLLITPSGEICWKRHKEIHWQTERQMYVFNDDWYNRLPVSCLIDD